MNKFLKIISFIIVLGLVFVVTSCSLFSGLGNVVTKVRNGENPIDDSITVKAVLFPVDDDAAATPTTRKPDNIIEEQKANEMNPDDEIPFTFENSILVGTKVKLYIGLKTKTTHKYYRSETVFVIEEGVNNIEEIGEFEEISASEARWWQ